MRTDYTEIFRDAANVEKYENIIYAPDSYSSAINRRQRDYLRGLARRAFPYRRPVQHDFACGTGRAIRILHGLVRSAHGYDTSAAMLAKAHEVGAYAQLHQIAAEGAAPVPVPTESPAIVTIFRLLLNVDDTVRDRAVAFAAMALPHYDAGLLVIENHGNERSLRHLRHRRHDTSPWFAELSHEQVTELLDRHGFSIVERRGFTLFTPGWYGKGWLRPIVSLLDDLIAKTGLVNGRAVNVCYVARRTRPTIGTLVDGSLEAADPLPAPSASSSAAPSASVAAPRKAVDRDGESW